MNNAPNRGERKCRTCVLYTDKQEEWDRDCKLDACECRAQQKEFGRAFCKNYKSKRYIDTSNHRDIGGSPTGLCEWKSPPILRKLLWDQWEYRLVNADASWCHCWTPIKPVIGIDQFPLIEAARAPALTHGQQGDQKDG